MIEVDDALDLVLKSTRPLTPRRTATADALGETLAENIASDIDSPPYDKSMVDGYALRQSDLRDGLRRFDVVEQITAGQTPSKTLRRGQAASIMTGAPTPPGADAVIMVERTESRSADSEGPSVEILDDRVPSGGNILRQAVSMHKGEQVLQRGVSLRAIELGLLAEVGRVDLLAHPRPSVSIVSTGNELVEPDQPLPAGMIRNSNGPMLAGLVREAGGVVQSAVVARDEESELHSRIEAGLQSDVLLLSGGVSAGVLDLVPKVLSDCGVEQVFHKVRLKPGKPLWFGLHRKSSGGERLVFALPGNPVSALVGFKLFIAPALDLLAGRLGDECQTLAPDWRTAELSGPHPQRGNRPTLHPAICRPANPSGNGFIADILPWRGSADLCALTQANALVYFPAGDREFASGETIKWMPL